MDLVKIANKIASQEQTAIIRKENGKWCVRSPKNSEWSGGCYDTKAEAEDRLKQVEMFKHMKKSSISLSKIASVVSLQFSLSRIASFIILAAIKKDELITQNPSLIYEIEELFRRDKTHGKYLEWCVEQVKSGSPVDQVSKLANQFDKYNFRLDDKDINYRSFSDLSVSIESARKELDEASKKLERLGIKQNKQKPYLDWLTSVVAQTDESFEDTYDDLAQFHKAKNENKLSGSEADIYSYKSTHELRLKLQEINPTQQLNNEQALGDVDKVYESDNWTVVMPRSQAASIAWGDGTTWCTAKPSGQNLFYNYVARDQPIILYYCVKKGVDPKIDPTAKLSIGVVDGKPELGGRDGHVSVDAANKGLTKGKLNEICGGNESDKILNAISSHTKSIGSEHPAKKVMESARTNVKIAKELTENLKPEEQVDLVKIMFSGDVSRKVVEHFLNSKNMLIIECIAENNTIPDVLDMLFHKYNNNNVIISCIASNIKTPSYILDEMSSYDNDNVVKNVAGNLNTPLNTLSHLSNHKNKSIVRSVASNNNTPVDILNKLLDLEDIRLDTYLALNENLTLEMINRLLKNEQAVPYIASNAKTPSSVLSDLSDSKYVEVVERVAGNPNTPPEVLAKLAGHNNERVIRRVAENSSTPPETLAKLKTRDQI